MIRTYLKEKNLINSALSSFIEVKLKRIKYTVEKNTLIMLNNAEFIRLRAKEFTIVNFHHCFFTFEMDKSLPTNAT